MGDGDEWERKVGVKLGWKVWLRLYILDSCEDYMWIEWCGIKLDDVSWV